MTQIIPTSKRNLPLDVLRGLTVALMIVVNNPGNWNKVYAPFLHAEWHGFTLTDLVFPTFLFVVGNAMSFAPMVKRNIGTRDFYKKIFKRAFLIFIIGFLLNCFPFFDFSAHNIKLNNILEVRLWGVLQRIGLCYFLAAIIARHFNNKAILIISTGTLLAYWGMLYFGYPTDPYSLPGNVAGKIDLMVFNAKNLYNGFGIPFEPEGLLSTLPSTVNVLAGYLIGIFLKGAGSDKYKAWRLGWVGGLLVIAALLWDPYFPINKPIWTSSYVLLSTGLDLLLLSTLIWIIDIAGAKKWTYFFVVFGKNPLFIYIVSWIVVKVLSLIPLGESSLRSLIYKNLFVANLSDKNASFLFAISYMLLMWVICYLMNKKKIYVKV